MIKVPEEAVHDPCKFLDTVAKDYHIRLYPPTLPHTAQIKYLLDMIHKIKTDNRPLAVTNICRRDNTVRDFVSVRRLQYGEVADMSLQIDIDVGEL